MLSTVFRMAAVAALVGLVALVALGVGVAEAQVLPNPYRQVEEWATLPGGRAMGAVGGVTMDDAGEFLWAVIRCEATALDRFGNECLDSDLDPVIKFNMDGEVVESLTPEGTRGHQSIKFSPTGEVLMTLGTPGEAGVGPDHFTSPADVAVADNGDIFVADGHGPAITNNRVVKFSKDGTYVQEWGQTGYGPGEFRGLHAIAIDNDGKVYVADRSNNRVQIFDQDGQFLAQWNQFGRPIGIFFDDHGRIYVADSESDDVQNPGWEMGIRIGDVETGWVTEFILYPWGDPRSTAGNGAEFVAVDRDGNIYGGEPAPRRLQKYVRVRP